MRQTMISATDLLTFFQTMKETIIDARMTMTGSSLTMPTIPQTMVTIPK